MIDEQYELIFDINQTILGLKKSTASVRREHQGLLKEKLELKHILSKAVNDFRDALTRTKTLAKCLMKEDEESKFSHTYQSDFSYDAVHDALTGAWGPNDPNLQRNQRDIILKQKMDLTKKQVNYLNSKNRMV